MSENKNKILVALDGSQKAFKTIKYLCSFKPFFKKELVLQNIITRVPECYYDLKKDPFSNKATSQVKAWELGYKAKIEGFMEKAKRNSLPRDISPKQSVLPLPKEIRESQGTSWMKH